MKPGQPFAFGRERRLRKRAEFLRAQDQGRRATTPHFVLLVVASPEGTRGMPARLGLVATRKIGCAVERNRFKRVCRACFRAWPELLPPGVDLVVIARHGAPALGLEDVRAEWRAVRPQLLKRAAQALGSPPGSPAASTPAEAGARAHAGLAAPKGRAAR